MSGVDGCWRVAASYTRLPVNGAFSPLTSGPGSQQSFSYFLRKVPPFFLILTCQLGLVALGARDGRRHETVLLTGHAPCSISNAERGKASVHSRPICADGSTIVAVIATGILIDKH